MYPQLTFPQLLRLSAQPENRFFNSICPLVFDQRAFFCLFCRLTGRIRKVKGIRCKVEGKTNNLVVLWEI